MNICDNVAILKVLYFIKTLLDIVLFIVPIGLIVIIMLDFAKNVIAGRDDEMKKNVSMVIKRIIYCVALFLVPTIVEFAINGIGNFNVDYQSCFNITLESIKIKEQEQKAQCSGEYEWNEALSICEKKPTNTNTNTNTSTIKNNNSYITPNNPSTGNSSSTKPSIKDENYHTGVKNLKYYNQRDSKWAYKEFCKSGYNLYKNGCGPTSLAVIASSFTDKKYTPAKTAEILCNNGHKKGGTNYNLLIKQEVLDELDLEVEVLFKEKYTKRNAGTKYDKKRGEAILKAVQQGRGVILLIPGHYVVVGPNEKCSKKEVYLYEVAWKPSNDCYTPKELFYETYNYSYKCTNENNCGWKSAYAYNSK